MTLYAIIGGGLLAVLAGALVLYKMMFRAGKQVGQAQEQAETSSTTSEVVSEMAKEQAKQMTDQEYLEMIRKRGGL
jgi:hypothetical protein